MSAAETLLTMMSLNYRQFWLRYFQRRDAETQSFLKEIEIKRLSYRFLFLIFSQRLGVSAFQFSLSKIDDD